MSADLRGLLVSVHNAARSRMAEALPRQLGGPRIEVTSAGFEPREVNPLVVEALAEIGLSLASNPRSPSVFDPFRAGQHFHHVIGVCAELQGLPRQVFPAVAPRVQRSAPDPTTPSASHDEGRARGFDAREALRARIESWLATLSDTGSTPRTTTRN